MQCPKCQAEVLEWHFYCQNCRTQIRNYKPEVEKPPRGRFERAGARALNALVWMSIIVVLVLTGRAVQWRELFAIIRGDANASVKSSTDPKVKRASNKGSDAGRADNQASTVAKSVEVSRREKNDAIESVRAMPQKIEELPPLEDQSQSQKPRLLAAPVKVENEPVGATPDLTSKSAIHTASSIDAHLGIEPVDAKNSDGTGLVAINSYTPARIYINGQFSGTTPRTIKLSAGDHQIRLIADGYEDWTRRVRLKSKQQVGVMASMKKTGAQKN